MITVSHVYYDYPGLRALDNVSFTLPRQSITALVGPNGAGKTTLMRNIAGLEQPHAGQIMIDGIDVWKSPRKAHLHMGYLPDHFGLYQELTALQCLTYAAWTHGLRNEAMTTAVQWAIEQVDLSPQLNQLASSLSRGQRQRLALAQAIVHRPKVLLLDEPASGLDPQARSSLSAMMKNLASQGMTLLISSHILAELETYCTAMLVLEQGKILTHESIQIATSPSTTTDSVDAPASTSYILRIGLLDNQDQTSATLCQWLNMQGYCAQTDGDHHVICNASFLQAEDQVELLRNLLANGWLVCEYAPHTVSLEDVYLQTVANNQHDRKTT